MESIRKRPVVDLNEVNRNGRGIRKRVLLIVDELGLMEKRTFIKLCDAAGRGLKANPEFA